MSDDRLRELERRARAGDTEAAARLARARVRSNQAGPIDRAHAAWSDGDAEQALDELLELWRTRPVPALADAIRAFSDHVAAPRGPVPGRTRDLKVLAWRELDASGDWFDVGRLMAVLPLLRVKQVASLMPTIEAWPRDPRVSEALVELLRHAPDVGWSCDEVWPLWDAVGRQLRRIADPRARGPLEGVIQSFDIFPASIRDDAHIPRMLSSVVLPGLRAAPPTLSPAEAEALDRFLRGFTRPGTGSLWDAVYSAPVADGPRRDLAEALEAQGDPRGEFIRLQLARSAGDSPGRREQRLRDEHWRDWAGSLLPYLTEQGDLSFERGFPAVARLANLHDGPPASARDWRTLRELIVSDWSRGRQSVVRFLQGLPELPPVVSGMPVELLERGVTCAQVSLGANPPLLERLAAARPSPALRALKLVLDVASTGEPSTDDEFRATWSRSLEAFWSSPFARSLEHLWLDGAPEVWLYRELLPGPAATPLLALRTLRVTHGARELVHYREAGAARWFTVLRPISRLPELLGQLERTEAIDPRIARLRIRLHTGHLPDPFWLRRSGEDPATFMARLEAAARRLNATVEVGDLL